MLNFVLPFLSLKTRIEENIPRNNSFLRHYLSLQTYNEEAYTVAKQQMLSQKLWFQYEIMLFMSKFFDGSHIIFWKLKFYGLRRLCYH